MGNGKFELIPLPQAVQLAPVTDIVTADYDGDNDEDIFIVGNDFSAEVFNGRLDALNGMVLRNDGKTFTVLSMEETGVYIPGEGKSLVKLKLAGGGEMTIAVQNRGKLKAYYNTQARNDKKKF